MKKLIAGLLALTMLFALCACGSKTTTEETPPAETPPTMYFCRMTNNTMMGRMDSTEADRMELQSTPVLPMKFLMAIWMVYFFWSDNTSSGRM